MAQISENTIDNAKQNESCEKILKNSGFFLYWSNKRKTKNEVWTKKI